MWKSDLIRGSMGAALAAMVIGSTLAVTPSVADAAPTTCGGVVFHDFDGDGERTEDYSGFNDAQSADPTRNDDEVDPGVAGVEVTVMTAAGSIFDTTTDADGAWQVTIDDSEFPVRVRFGSLPTGFVSAPLGVDSAGSVQFIEQAADCAQGFGVLDPARYCDAVPQLYTSCFLYGNIANHDDEPAVVRLSDGTQDDNSESDWATPGYTVTATLGQVGTVWGHGLDRLTGDLYLGSMVKRHTRLAGNPTTIYRQTASGSVGAWFTTDPSATDPHTATADAAALGLGDPLAGWTYDFGAFDDVGKAGLGDVEVSPDGSTVHTVDLGRRELISIPIEADGTAGTATRTPITAAALGVSADCDERDIRPFGLGFDDDGMLHVGVVCSAESTVPDPFVPITSAGPALGDPTAIDGWVHAFDGSAFTPVAAVPLPTTSRGGSIGSGTEFSQQAEWRPWVDRMPYAPADLPSFGNTYPQPMVSDVAFDGDDLIVAVMDRWAHQTGPDSFFEDWSNPVQPNPGFESDQPVSSGDLVRGRWNGTAYEFPAADDDARDFTYDGDNYGTVHAEITIGAVAQIPGRPYVIANAFDPNAAADTWRSGGLVWLDNTTGEHLNGVRLYNGRSAGIDVGTFEKAAGIGDIEVDCGRAPIQIGNRVWFDADRDGLQDPDETPLDGVAVELLDASGTVIDTTTTSTDGTYRFDGIEADTDLAVRLASVNYEAGGVFATDGSHADRGTPTTALADPTVDDLDSDAVLVDGLPTITLNVSTTDHTFDFGLHSSSGDGSSDDGPDSEDSSDDDDQDAAGGIAIAVNDPGSSDTDDDADPDDDAGERPAGADLTPGAPETLAFTGPGTLVVQLAVAASLILVGGLLVQLATRRRRPVG